MSQPAPTAGPSRVVRFGVFELDAQTGELRKAGVRLSLQDQPLQVLAMLSERPGELVTREELKHRLWPGDTFVDFEQGLNGAVKRLRYVLGDSADTPRFIETLPRRGYRLIAPVTGVGSSDVPRRPRAPRVVAFAAAAAVLASVIGLAPWWRRSPVREAAAGPRVLTRLTFDAGLQMQPTWSPDGRFIAYTSDRAGNFDIWVRPVAGGDAVQVTKDAAYDWEPDWSPDGTQIAFRSEREGGGIFLVRALGGEERKLTSFGYRPRWSSDGTRLLFGMTNFQDHGVVPRLWVVGTDGTPPRRILGDFLSKFAEGRANWHPDGRISVWARGEARSAFGRTVHFWTIPEAGGEPVRSEPLAEVKRNMDRLGLAYRYDDFAWEPDGRAIDFTATSHGVASVWRVEVDPATLRWTRGPDRLTTGAGADTDVAVARDGRTIAFATAPRSSRLWSFPLDPATATITGEGQAITDAQWHASGNDLTADGKRVVYVVEHPGARHERTWIERTLAGGSERSLLVDDLSRVDDFTSHDPPRWSPDGRRLLYREATRKGTAFSTSIHVLDTVTGHDQQLTSPQTAMENPSGWSPDGKWVVSSSTRHLPERLSLALLPVDAGPHAEAKAEVITSDSLRCHILWQAAISPDGRWIAVQAASVPQGARSTLYVVPRAGGPWTQMTEGTYWDDKPRWSSDGRFLYFVSSRGGVINVWAVPFDPASGLPVGAPTPVTSFSGARRVMPQITSMQIAVAGDRLVLPIVDVSGGVWMLENVTR